MTGLFRTKRHANTAQPEPARATKPRPASVQSLPSTAVRSAIGPSSMASAPQPRSATTPHVSVGATTVAWPEPPQAARPLPPAPGGPTLDVQALSKKIIESMQAANLCRASSASSAGSAAPWLGLAPAMQRTHELRTWLGRTFPVLDDRAVVRVQEYMTRRAHAERADPAAVTTPIERGLQTALALLTAGKPYSQVRAVKNKPGLLHLVAPHYDECLFNPQARVGRGGQGGFFVGLTKFNHPVAIKGLVVEAAAKPAPTMPRLHSHHLAPGGVVVDGFGMEAQAIRTGSQYDYLHLVQMASYRWIVMRIFNGDLDSNVGAFINLRPATGKLSECLFGARYLLSQLLQRLQVLHEVDRKVHQDVKAKNIFLDKSRQEFVLADLGVSGAIEANGLTRSRGYTRGFAAPEQCRRGALIGPKADIYALGVTLYDMLVQSNICMHQWRESDAKPQTQPIADTLFPVSEPVDDMSAPAREFYYRALADTLLSEDNVATDQSGRERDLLHFRGIHKALVALDMPLGQLLHAMVQQDPDLRPTAAQALAVVRGWGPLEGAFPALIAAAWAEGVPQYSPEATAELATLRPILAEALQ